MRLIAWRPKLFSLCLIVILFNTTFTIVPSPPEFQQTSPSALQLLDGWCYALEIENRGVPVLWSRGQLELSEASLKILMIWRWISIVVWGCLSAYLLLELLPDSGSSFQWLLLLILSHKLVADLREQRKAWLNVLHEEAAYVCQMQQLMVLARMTKSVQEVEIASPELLQIKDEKQVPKSIKTTNLLPSEEMVNQLAKLVVDLPIGTNLGMFHFLWMMVSGQLLASRGAIFPALQAVGLEKQVVRRAWAAFSSKSWRVESLLARRLQQIITAGQWQEHVIQGYRPKAVDLTAFWRPTAANCQTKHYDARAGKAMPAVVLGLAARVGDTNGQRIPLPELLVRADSNDPSEKQLERKLIIKLKEIQEVDEIHIFDAGFDLSMLIELALERFVIRLPTNFVGRRNKVKEYCGRGTRPKYGEQVRPLGRQSKTRWIEADASDSTLTILDGDVEIKVELWQNLVHNSDKPGAKSFNVMAFHDPRYKEPWLLATDVGELTPQSVRAFYKDRWPVEQLPLAAKQMLGAHRQFVWSEENIQRLPELSLLVGSILTHVAATLPPIPTGFWDRAPKATPGRLRRFLNLKSLDSILANLPLPTRIRKKESCTNHLKTGISARRAKRATNTA